MSKFEFKRPMDMESTSIAIPRKMLSDIRAIAKENDITDPRGISHLTQGSLT